jgi:hypothetical protein
VQQCGAAVCALELELHGPHSDVVIDRMHSSTSNMFQAISNTQNRPMLGLHNSISQIVP